MAKEGSVVFLDKDKGPFIAFWMIAFINSQRICGQKKGHVEQE